MSSFCDKPCIKASAFKILYLVAFIFALISILGAACANLQLGETTGEFVKTMSPFTRRLNFGLALLAIIGFSVGVIVHFFRIYVTLEMMEETEWMRDKYFKRLSPNEKVIEFLIRTAIVFLGSMTAAKTLHLPFTDSAKPWLLPVYLAFFYSVLVSWSIFIRSRTSIRINTFLLSDVPMLIGSVFLIILAIEDPEGKESVMPYVIVYLVLAICLLWSLIKDLISNRGFFLYTGHFVATAISIRQGTIRHEDAVGRMPNWLKTKYPEVINAQSQALEQLLTDSQAKWEKKRNGSSDSSSTSTAPEAVSTSATNQTEPTGKET
jgi:hypothetical protein